MKQVLCPCNSGKIYSKCCAPYFTKLGLETPTLESETSFLDWLERYSGPIYKSFMKKTRPYLFRISCYLDSIVDQYFDLGFCGDYLDQNTADEAVFNIKHNVLLSLFASLSCLSQGLFIQSGIILRSAFEDCFVLVDIFENKQQIRKLMEGKYTTNGLISRVKIFLPDNVIGWYGHLSANFAHFGPIHSVPYVPRACYPDNFVLVIGIRNIVRTVVTFHVVLERIYFDQTIQPVLWQQSENDRRLIFSDNSQVFNWTEQLGKEIVSKYNPKERKESFRYNSKTYRLK